MELKVDVSRSRCRAFWDRSRLERALETLGAWRTLYSARTIWLGVREVQPYHRLAFPGINLNRQDGFITRTSPLRASSREISPVQACQDMQTAREGRTKLF